MEIQIKNLPYFNKYKNNVEGRDKISTISIHKAKNSRRTRSKTRQSGAWTSSNISPIQRAHHSATWFHAWRSDQHPSRYSSWAIMLHRPHIRTPFMYFRGVQNKLPSTHHFRCDCRRQPSKRQQIPHVCKCRSPHHRPKTLCIHGSNNKKNNIDQPMIIFYMRSRIRSLKHFFLIFLVLIFIFTIENKIILYIMSITVSTSEQICHSPTNKSRSKMLFSFSKSSRFAHHKENKGHKFYDLTGCMRKRSTCFGYGNKYDFTKEMPNTPAPGTYEKQTLFDISKKKNKGFCFGSGREQMQVTGLTPKNENPGPGTYSSFSQRGKISYSLRAKFKVDNREKIYVPGPGKYEAYSTFNLSKRNFLAKHINKSACRFQIAEKLKTEDLKIPGPGAYDTSKTDLSPEGRYCLSKLRTVKSRRFGTSLRSTFQNRCQTPGPGNYKISSEFGHYLSKKYSAEAKT